jgi:hypothetical protein
MKSNFILWDTIEEKTIKYPRNDDEPVVGLDPRYQALKVIRDAAPTEIPEGMKIEQIIYTDFDAGEYHYGWKIVPVEPQIEPPNWSRFKNSLLSHPEINSMLNSGMSVLPTAVITLPTTLLNSENTGNVDDFRTVWIALRRSGLVNPDLVQIVRNLAINNHLPKKFIDAIGGNIRPEPTELGQEWMDAAGQMWRVEQSRGEDGQFLPDGPTTFERESLDWVEVTE